MRSPVQGYEYQSVDDDNPRNGTICQIKRRADQLDNDASEYGCAFMVVFGDGMVLSAYGSELRPWYPV